MKAIQFVKDHGVEQAQHLLNLLKNLGCSDDMKFTVINGMWHRSSNGFTCDELDQIIKSHELVKRFGGLQQAKDYVPDGYKSKDLKQAISDVEACQ
jgi:hypothetical protein